MRHPAISLTLAALLGACSVANQDHCANLAGHATCEARGGATPFCSKCTADNDGCVAQVVADCDAGETTTPGSTSLAGTTALTTTEPLTTTTASTSSSSSSTGEPPTDTTTTGGSTTDASTGTTGDPPLPMCGNDVREPPEICDGTDLNGLDCVVKDPSKYSGGSLQCAADCKAYDEQNCCLASGQPCQIDGQLCCADGPCVLMCK